MPNDFFEFKKFRIQQDRCAMKVSTDACVQGAFFAHFLAQKKSIRRVLDIGAGTGLLTLMLAQALPQAVFTALEIDPEAAQQAKENMKTSAWSARITVDLQDFKSFESPTRFDAIICNPPFFKNHLKSQNQGRNKARHDDGLSKIALAKGVMKYLSEGGVFCVLYPFSEWDDWLESAIEAGLRQQHTVMIRPNPQKAVNRVLGIFSKNADKATQEALCIYDASGTYSNAFCRLLAAYYLHL